jgi:hypothetical protein
MPVSWIKSGEEVVLLRTWMYAARLPEAVGEKEIVKVQEPLGKIVLPQLFD